MSKKEGQVAPFLWQKSPPFLVLVFCLLVQLLNLKAISRLRVCLPQRTALSQALALRMDHQLDGPHNQEN